MPLNQRGPRQRQNGTHVHGAATEDPAVGFPSISSFPQRFDTVGGKADSAASRISTSPNRHSFGTASPFSIPPVLPNTSAGSYDSSQVSGVIEGELSVAMRGMAVEHEHGIFQHPSAPTPQVSSLADLHTSRPAARTVPLTQPQRSSFPGFPQPDYSAYYNGASYSFDVYQTTENMYGSPALNGASPTLYAGMPTPAIQPHSAPDMRGSPSAYYDYTSSGRPPSYYYAAQPMMYHAAPPPNHGVAGGGGGHQKRRSMQVRSVVGLPQKLSDLA